MKTVSRLFMSFCLVMGLGAAMVASAQIESDVTLAANIPHAFVVRDTQLPAGKYTVKVADENDPTVLEIRSADGRTVVLFETENTQPNQMPSKSELVFDKIGDNYFLSKIFLEGDDSGSQLVESKMELKLKGDGARSEGHSIAASISHAVKSIGKKGS